MFYKHPRAHLCRTIALVICISAIFYVCRLLVYRGTLKIKYKNALQNECVSYVNHAKRGIHFYGFKSFYLMARNSEQSCMYLFHIQYVLFQKHLLCLLPWLSSHTPCVFLWNLMWTETPYIYDQTKCLPSSTKSYNFP